MKANISRLTDQLWVGGDCSVVPHEGEAQRDFIVQQGITHILDCRVEIDSEYEGEWYEAAGLDYSWIGVDDRGGRQPDSWWEEGITEARRAIESGGVVLVHCHMGVNRAPSMAFAILVGVLGFEPYPALRLIKASRPEAFAIYADQYLRWAGYTASYARQFETYRRKVAPTSEQRQTISRLQKEDRRQYNLNRILKEAS